MSMKHLQKSRYYESIYPKVFAWFQKHTAARKILKAAYKGLPVLVAAFYACIILHCFFFERRTLLFKELLIPAALFLTVTLLRKRFDFDRPYCVYPVKSLVEKDKRGESFPSRHSASAVVIASAGCFVSIHTGIILFVLAFLISVTRLLAGVHFPRDLLGGWGIGLAFGFLFFL